MDERGVTLIHIWIKNIDFYIIYFFSKGTIGLILEAYALQEVL